MKTISKIDELLVGVEFNTPMWHVLHILQMNAVQDEIAIQDAMEEINEHEYEDECPHERLCQRCKFDKANYPACQYLYILNKHTGLEPIPHE